jgi:small nuclear ribonucleoprotein (snRNP)-like protein
VRFVIRLRMLIGNNVELVLSNGDIVKGVLAEVNCSYVMVRTAGVLGYDGEEELLIRTRLIDYVRVI